ncbi:hypothetical protein B566_EDAN018380 [Ephemera danica]|nr:hypothetical protein B566_EDAN018380 [Ephemera danica]
MSDEADTDGFRVVKNKKRGAPSTPPSASGSPQTPRKIAKVKHSQPKAGPSGAQQPAPGPSRPPPTATASKARIPSIILDACVASESFLHDFKKRYAPAYIEMKYRGNKIQVYTEDSQTHRNLTTHAERTNQKYTVYKLEEDKPKKVVIRNIPPYIEEVKVYDALVDLKYSVESVSQMTRNRKTTKLPLFLATLRKDGNHENIMNMKNFMMYRVRVETYKPRGILQCYNCQEFSHSSKVCKRDAACLHCGQGHDTRNCENKATIAPRCANCKGDHKAFARDCPTRVAYAKQYNKRTNFDGGRTKPPHIPKTPIQNRTPGPTPHKVTTPKSKQGNTKTPRTQRRLGYEEFATPLAPSPPKKKQQAPSENSIARAALDVAIIRIKQKNNNISEEEIIAELIILSTTAKNVDESHNRQVIKDFFMKLTQPN